MSVNPLASALRAIGTQGAQGTRGTQAGQPSSANAFGAIGKDFDFLMQALGSADQKGSALDALMQGLSAGPVQFKQAGSSAQPRVDTQAASAPSAAPQVSAREAIRFVNSVSAPLASVGKNISVTA